MSKMNLKVLGVLSILAATTILFVVYKKNYRNYLISYQDKNNYQLEDMYENSSESFRALYKYDNYYVRLEVNKNIVPGDTEFLIKKKENRFQEIFQNDIAPYPGEVSTVRGCGDEFRPKKIIINDKQFFTAFLNSRHQFGSCDKNQLIYKGIIGHIYCPKDKNLYQIEYFFDKDIPNGDEKLKSFASSIKCP